MDRSVKNSIAHITFGIEQIIESQIEVIKELIMDGYDSLSVKVSDPKSKTNPEMFRDKFQGNLNTFEFLYKSEAQIQLNTPDMVNFNFSGIPVVEQILEGTVGTFVEISHEDLIKLIGKTTINEDPIDPSATKRERVYLIKYDDKVRRGEKTILKKKLIRFSFSNSPALDDTVFGPAEEYVNENMETWIERSLKVSTK